MSQEVGQTELKAKTQQLLDGPLKHIRAAAIAAALLPLASVVATPASAQTVCPSGGVCGIAFNDANHNGIQDAGEGGVENVHVFVYDITNPAAPTLIGEAFTGTDGAYSVFVTGGTPVMISALIPTGDETSPSNVGSDTFDSDGENKGAGFSVATMIVNSTATDFGFFQSAASNPGTGTPGYWKNHPEAWPVGGITIGANTYTKAQAIAWLGKVGKDKTTTIFASYVSAFLNGQIGNDTSCVFAAMNAAYTWLSTYSVGSNIAASSTAWQQIEWAHQTMDAYNNGLLCAPHRQ